MRRSGLQDQAAGAEVADGGEDPGGAVEMDAGGFRSPERATATPVTRAIRPATPRTVRRDRSKPDRSGQPLVELAEHRGRLGLQKAKLGT
jgi:hypothetical protein